MHLRPISLAAFVILLTAACAPAGQSGGSAGGSTPPAPPPKLLTMGVNSGEEPKDGGFAFGAGGSNSIGPIFHSSLTVYDEKGVLQPVLAERVPTTQNGDWKGAGHRRR